MKIKLFVIAIAALACVGTTAYAQNADESNVKILRAAKPGILKLHYAIQTSAPVVVKFFNENGVLGTDKIKGEFPTGLSKKYDVRKIDDSQFWVEVSSANRSLTYRITPSKDGKTFTSMLEKSTSSEPMVKRN
jgi:hypothetical protein